MTLRLLLLLAALAGPLSAEDAGLRVVTFNIHHGRGTDDKLDLERVAKALTALKPDVVALQEVDRGTKRSGGVDQLARLAELTGWHFAYGQTMPFQGGQYGNAILSRFPITGAKSHPLPTREGQEPRGALLATITPEHGLPAFHLVSTHFSHDREDARRDQADALLAKLKPLGKPVVVGADFNARPQSEPMERFWKAGWIDQVRPDSVIDYILTREADPWKRLSAKVIDDRVTSDHAPVLVTLRWDGKQPGN